MPERFRGELLAMGHYTNPASFTFTFSLGGLFYSGGTHLCEYNIYERDKVYELADTVHTFVLVTHNK